jgi:hypothetical protein
MSTFSIAHAIAFALYSAWYWGVLTTAKSLVIASATVIVGMFVAAAIALVQVAYVMLVGTGKMLRDQQLRTQRVRFVAQLGIATVTFAGAIGLVVPLCGFLAKEELVAGCPLSTVDQVLLLATRATLVGASCCSPITITRDLAHGG